MKSFNWKDKALLRRTAQAIYEELERRTDGTSLELRWPGRIGETNTGGWRMFLGSLGKGQPRLQVWFDRFSGRKTRKFWYGFYIDDLDKLRLLAKQASKKLPTHRKITEKHAMHGDFFALKRPLRQNEFSVPILEEYCREDGYFGKYDLSHRPADDNINFQICARAAAFFESVARSRPHATPESQER